MRVFHPTNGMKHMHELVAMLRILDPDWPHESISAALPTFDLENGAEQLLRWFEEVVLLRYEDYLVVTEAEPLVEYLLSGMRGQALREELPIEEFREQVSALKDRLERETLATYRSQRRYLNLESRLSYATEDDVPLMP